VSEQFDELVRIMARLRAPDGCPWDRKQTHDSLKPYLLEETYEVLETIDHQDTHKLKEELGDLLLQIVFHAQIGTESGTFTIREVMEQLAEKLVRRHPHVFGQVSEEAHSLNAEQVYSRWEQIKRDERTQSGRESSALEGVPKALPALLRAYQVQARASRVGFDWPHTAQGMEHVFDKIEEEVKELREATLRSSEGPQPASSDEGASTDRSQIEAELGDMLFSVVNLARFLKVNPEDTLRQATNRFCDRFHYIESEAAKSGRRMEDLTLAEMDRLWEEAKAKSSKKLAASEETP
jgi:tetrapyrrole methylase family protein/MazG family protein